MYLNKISHILRLLLVRCATKTIKLEVNYHVNLGGKSTQFGGILSINVYMCQHSKSKERDGKCCNMPFSCSWCWFMAISVHRWKAILKGDRVRKQGDIIGFSLRQTCGYQAAGRADRLHYISFAEWLRAPCSHWRLPFAAECRAALYSCWNASCRCGLQGGTWRFSEGWLYVQSPQLCQQPFLPLHNHFFLPAPAAKWSFICVHSCHFSTKAVALCIEVCRGCVLGSSWRDSQVLLCCLSVDLLGERKSTQMRFCGWIPRGPFANTGAMECCGGKAEVCAVTLLGWLKYRRDNKQL